VLTSEDIQDLSVAKGHETNKYLRLVQSRLDANTGNFLHKGNTSSDVLDTSLSLQILESLVLLAKDFEDLSAVLKAMAIQYKFAKAIFRSHGQQAVPGTWGRRVLGWYAEVKRGKERIKRAQEVISFGKLSGEVGTNVFISPELEKRSLEKLGLRPDQAPTQVISRDRHAEVLGLIAVNGAILERIATNVALLSRSETGEVREPFEAEAQQGSSAMPHKRNPEISERIRGLNRRIRHAAAEELECAVLWDERDISHSSTERFTMPDIFGCLAYATRLTIWMIRGLELDTKRLSENMNLTYGAIYASRLLNELIEVGLTRTDTYELVKSLALEAIDKKQSMLELAAKNKTIKSLINKQELKELFDPDFYLRNISVAYERLNIAEET
jgi:adenylosuccinate lyase